MSSVVYGNEGIPTNDDTSIPILVPSSSGAIIQHPYIIPNTNVAFATVSSAVGPYQHYYGHSIPPQPPLHIPQAAGFYPTSTPFNPHQHHGDFSNSSPSIASSSSSIESSRKTNNRKRNAAGSENVPGTAVSAKSSAKRKLPNDHDNDLDDDDDDDDDDEDENKCYLRDGSIPNVMMSNNHPNNGITGGDEDKEKQARENHCEIERRRRVKMATYFAELCDMVPSCSNLARKPDKLTILRMAAQFMKNLRTTNNSLAINTSQIPQQQHDLHKPSFLNDQELKYLLVESCDAFLFALNCDNLRVIYISDAIQHILSYTCQDWYSRFFYDFVHPDDVEKVREQLNLQPQDGSPNGNVNGRVLDLKTGTVKKDGHAAGARLASSKRSFICRLRVGSTNPLDHTHQNPFVNPSVLRRRHHTSLGPSTDGHFYEIVHISGYIRNLNTHYHASSHHENTTHHPSSSNSTGQMAFIAIARVQNSCSPNINDLTNSSISTLNCTTSEFTCRCHCETSEILFIDQRCTSIIGYKTPELLHKILFDQIHHDDQIKFQDFYKRTVTQKNLPNTTSSNLTNIILRFRTNIDNEYVSLKTSTYAFCNPCTDDIEFIIVTFLSSQPITTTTAAAAAATNKTSVITNSNDYNRQAYETYPRTTTTTTTNSIPHYSTQSPSTYNNNPEGQDYTTANGTNDGRTYASNNSGSTWASANDNWTSGNPSTSTVEFVDTSTTLPLYHQYHQ